MHCKRKRSKMPRVTYFGPTSFTTQHYKKKTHLYIFGIVFAQFHSFWLAISAKVLKREIKKFNINDFSQF